MKYARLNAPPSLRRGSNLSVFPSHCRARDLFVSSFGIPPPHLDFPHRIHDFAFFPAGRPLDRARARASVTGIQLNLRRESILRKIDIHARSLIFSSQHSQSVLLHIYMYIFFFSNIHVYIRSRSLSNNSSARLRYDCFANEWHVQLKTSSRCSEFSRACVRVPLPPARIPFILAKRARGVSYECYRCV